MTFPCKEEFMVFEQLERQQVQIYPDACDYGVRLKDIKNIEFVRKSLNELIKFYKNRNGYKTRQWHNGKAVELFIPVELDGRFEEGVSLEVIFNNDSAGGFITINIFRSRYEVTK